MPVPSRASLRSACARTVLRPLAVGLAAACALMGRPAPSRAEEPPPIDAKPTTWELWAGQQVFAVDLYARLKDAPGNLLFSPHSIQTALAMARAGARGETAAQMDRALRVPGSIGPVIWKAFVRDVATPQRERERRDDGTEADVPAYTVSIANALFGQRDCRFEPAYRELLATHFGAELRDVDFAAGPAVRKEINDWVLSQTNDRIKDLIPEGQPTADTLLALVNAVHFLAPWDQPFAASATEDAEFTGAGGAKTKVRMMHRTSKYGYRDDGDVEVARIWYRGNRAQLLIVRPKAADGLAAVEKSLTPERVARWWDVRLRKVALGLPRFKFEAATDVTPHLQAMGMTDAFTPEQADFTGMLLVHRPLHIGAVLHKAFIAVDEKGTEAASSARMFGIGSAEEPIPFICDRPFLFLLKAGGATLFMGRLAAPAPESAPPAGTKAPAR